MESVLEFIKSEWVLLIGGAVYVLIEYWLGETSVVKPGSVLASVLLGIKKVLELLGIKKPKDPNALS